jgi:hypothetical protein
VSTSTLLYQCYAQDNLGVKKVSAPSKNPVTTQQVTVVLDHASRIRDVVLVRRIFSSGNPRGSGIWNGEGMGRGWKGGDQFTSNLGPRWTGSYHSKEGFQVSKREWKGSKVELTGGSKRQGDCAIIMLSICIHVYNDCLNVEYN